MSLWICGAANCLGGGPFSLLRGKKSKFSVCLSCTMCLFCPGVQLMTDIMDFGLVIVSLKPGLTMTRPVTENWQISGLLMRLGPITAREPKGTGPFLPLRMETGKSRQKPKSFDSQKGEPATCAEHHWIQLLHRSIQSSEVQSCRQNLRAAGLTNTFVYSNLESKDGNEFWK